MKNLALVSVFAVFLLGFCSSAFCQLKGGGGIQPTQPIWEEVSDIKVPVKDLKVYHFEGIPNGKTMNSSKDSRLFKNPQFFNRFLWRKDKK